MASRRGNHSILCSGLLAAGLVFTASSADAQSAPAVRRVCARSAGPARPRRPAPNAPPGTATRRRRRPEGRCGADAAGSAQRAARLHRFRPTLSPEFDARQRLRLGPGGRRGTGLCVGAGSLQRGRAARAGHRAPAGHAAAPDAGRPDAGDDPGPARSPRRRSRRPPSVRRAPKRPGGRTIPWRRAPTRRSGGQRPQARPSRLPKLRPQPSSQASAQPAPQPAASTNGRGGARYYSVHREAGRERRIPRPCRRPSSWTARRWTWPSLRRRRP